MKSTIISIFVALAIVGVAIFFSSGNFSSGGNQKASSVIENGKQYIDITASGGYYPRQITAKAGMPSTIRMRTNGTFDCSSFLVIPSLGYRSNLPQSGVTEIELPAKSAGEVVRGTCGMGMYGFSIIFE